MSRKIAGIKPELSAQQRQVLTLVARGKTDEEIAHTLNLRKTTVKTHLRRLCKKLGAINRIHAVTLGHHYTLLDESLLEKN